MKWITCCPLEFKPIYYRRYVDDIVVLFRKEEHLELFKSYLNSCHENINFTHELEKENCLPFLDIKIFRENNSLFTSVYRKKTFTGVYSNFSSLIPLHYKKGLIFTLLHRIYSICSNSKLFRLEVTKLVAILKLNGYPLKFINNCITQFVHKIHTKRKPNKDEEVNKKEVISIKLPFLGKTSLYIKKQLANIIKLNIPNCQVRFIFLTPRRLSCYFNFKDRIPKGLQSHLVYKIQCEGCNLFYYGLTERHLEVRGYDHLGLSILTGKPIKGVNTAIKTHWRENKHNITWDSIKVIARDENTMNLRIKESLLIKRDKPYLNANLYSTPLYLF